MNEKRRYQILLTNDDGIQSPGLWAAAESLSKLGYVTVAAPRDQASGTGRSMPVTSDGKITVSTLKIGEQDWQVYAVGGTPAQTVLHAILELMPVRPDLVVSGINYGENVGHSITISGTVGAAIEAAACGVPALAVSLQLKSGVNYLSYSTQMDFSTAAYFTGIFACLMLENRMPEDVDILKVDLPYAATPETPWRMTRLAQHRYYVPAIHREGGVLDNNGAIVGTINLRPGDVPPDTDAHTLAFDEVISVTPLSLDMTSRVDLKDLENQFRASIES
jgi:5'-nucleotidase